MSRPEEQHRGKVDVRVLGRMVQFALPHWPLFLVSIALLVGGIAAELAQPYLVKIAIDSYINVPEPDAASLLRLLWVYLAVVICAFALNYIQANLLQRIGRSVVYSLRLGVFSHLLHLSLGFFDRNPVGRLVTRVCNDTEAINQLFSQAIVQSLRDILTIIGIVIVMFRLDPELALISLVTVPIIFAISTWFRRALRDAYRTSRYHLARLNAYLAENLAGMKTVQLFNRQKPQFDRFQEINGDYLAANVREAMLTLSYSNVLAVFGQLAVALMMWYGGGEVVRGQIPFGVLYAFISYIRQFFQPINHLTQQLNTVQAALTSSERLAELLDEKPEVVDVPQPLSLPTTIRGEIRFENVWFAYVDEHWVLKDVSFTVEPGQTVAFVGATGAGKSSIINLISRLYDVQRGCIRLDGVDIRQVSQRELRRHIAVVQQDVFLFAGDIKTNIRLGNAAISDAAVAEAARAIGADQFIERLPGSYGAPLFERGQTLSAGQRQLISFARALAFDPAILVLDEATASIDTETERAVQMALQRLTRGRTTLIIAHRLSTIQHADQIFVLDQGRIVERGTHARLLALGGLYARLYELSWQEQSTGAG